MLPMDELITSMTGLDIDVHRRPSGSLCLLAHELLTSLLLRDYL